MKKERGGIPSSTSRRDMWNKKIKKKKKETLEEFSIINIYTK